MGQNAKIIYFTGTGGTALAAHTLAKALGKQRIQAETDELFRDNIPTLEKNDILIVMFPVYAADAPAPVRKWIKQLTVTKDGKACVVSVSGGGEISPNTACRKRTVRRLRKKGYDVFGEYMLCMPSNFIEPTDEKTAVHLINILPHKCAVIADKIANGMEVCKKANPIDHVLLALFAIEKMGAKVFGKTLKANDMCNGCGLCAKKCPRGNIIMHEGKPKFGWKCVICMRCLYSCPKGSIKSTMPVLKKMVLKEGYSLKAVPKNTEDEEMPDIDGRLEGYLWKGVKNYLENPDSV